MKAPIGIALIVFGLMTAAGTASLNMRAEANGGGDAERLGQVIGGALVSLALVGGGIWLLRSGATKVAAATASPQPEILSLDDEPPAAPVPWVFPFRTAMLVVVIVLLVGGGTLAVLRYGSGSIPASAWSDFTPPDGSCTIALPGTPTAERVDPSPADTIARGLQQYTTTGWYSRARVWFGWRDLDPAWVKQAAMDRDGALTTPILAAERDLRKKQTGGTVVKEGTVRFGANTGLEVQIETPRGKLIERYIVALEGPRPRLYFMGFEAKRATSDGPSAQKLFNSFRVNKD